MRKDRKALDKKCATKARRSYLDYDYVDKLSEVERDWLARFSDEFYAADFEINPTFVRYSDCMKTLKKMIKTEENQKKIEKYKKQLELYKELKGEKFVQISSNKQKIMNLDLRKFRTTKKFYDNGVGDLVCDEKYKYSSNNIHSPEMLKSCNANANSSQRDIMSVGNQQKQTTDSGLDLLIENIDTNESDTEELLIAEEKIDEIETIKKILKN